MTRTDNAAVADAVLEQNKDVVRAFYQAAIVEKSFAKVRPLLGDSYTQHNPRIADGFDGLAAFIDGLAGDFPDITLDIKRLVAEGNYVVSHVHGIRVPGQPGTAIIDIFRFADGRIVEHWDVMQPPRGRGREQQHDVLSSAPPPPGWAVG